MSNPSALGEMIKSTALKNGAILVGFTKIRLTEPVILFAFPFTDQWFLSKPLTVAELLFRTHAVSKDVLDQTAKILKSEGYLARCKTIWSVYGDFRPLAVAASLGSWGRNGIIVNNKYGAGLLFAAIFTDAPLESSKGSSIESQHCLSCGECIRACPGKAFTRRGFHIQKCLPYSLRGCANCLKACPDRHH